MDPRETVSGAFGALCCISAGQPFDVVKARLQSQVAVPQQARLGPLGVLLTTARLEGAGGLFKGFRPALASATTENIVVWSVNSFLREKLEQRNRREQGRAEISRRQHALLGAATGVCSSVMICPAEVLKVRQQVAVGSPRSAGAVAREVLRTEGARGLFLGLTPLLCRDVPFYFFFFAAMESYLDKVAAPMRKKHAGGVLGNELLHSAMGGGLAGSFAWAIVFPVDVLKTRAQVYGRQAGLGMLVTLKQVLAADGPRGLFRGWLPAVLRGFPANGALVMGVHAARNGLDKLFPATWEPAASVKR